MDNPEPEITVARDAVGVQAADTLLKVLSAFIDDESEFMLKTLAARSGMPPAKAHRYLVSLCRMNFVIQDPTSNRYRLGAAALRLAFATRGTINASVVARPLMADICSVLRHSVVLSVWQPTGPTVVLSEIPPGPLGFVVREGTTLPLLRSATGRVFASWLPNERTETLIAAELGQLKSALIEGCPTTNDEVQRLLADIRSIGLARATGQLNPGAHALAAPVFDAAGDISAVISVLGPAGAFDSRWTGPTAMALREVANDLSRQLGHRGTAQASRPVHGVM